MALPRSSRTHSLPTDTHENPVTHISDPSWGRGVPYTRYRIYFVKPTSKFHDKVGNRQIKKTWAQEHPRSVLYRYGYTSKATKARISPESRIDLVGEKGWVTQGLISSPPEHIKKKTVRQKWAKNLYKTLTEYRTVHLPPEGSDDLDRFMHWIKGKQSSFYEALVEKKLAPEDPSEWTRYFKKAKVKKTKAERKRNVRSTRASRKI